jgi:hypothetical protein
LLNTNIIPILGAFPKLKTYFGDPKNSPLPIQVEHKGIKFREGKMVWGEGIR